MYNIQAIIVFETMHGYYLPCNLFSWIVQMNVYQKCKKWKFELQADCGGLEYAPHSAALMVFRGSPCVTASVKSTLPYSNMRHAVMTGLIVIQLSKWHLTIYSRIGGHCDIRLMSHFLCINNDSCLYSVLSFILFICLFVITTTSSWYIVYN